MISKNEYIKFIRSCGLIVGRTEDLEPEGYYDGWTITSYYSASPFEDLGKFTVYYEQGISYFGEDINAARYHIFEYIKAIRKKQIKEKIETIDTMCGGQ